MWELQMRFFLFDSVLFFLISLLNILRNIETTTNMFMINHNML